MKIIPVCRILDIEVVASAGIQICVMLIMLFGTAVRIVDITGLIGNNVCFVSSTLNLLKTIIEDDLAVIGAIAQRYPELINGIPSFSKGGFRIQAIGAAVSAGSSPTLRIKLLDQVSSVTGGPLVTLTSELLILK